MRLLFPPAHSCMANSRVLTAPNLRHGNPFTYSERAISEISATEAFNTGINRRDQERCVVCGCNSPGVLEHAHIVPKIEFQTWEDLRIRGFIPERAKSVAHEARNGILLCCNHHRLFDIFAFYIRWIPEARRFVLINFSGDSSLIGYDGRAIDINADGTRVPFHGAFLIHEMRVRGRWPFADDQPFPWPLDQPARVAHDGEGDDGTNTDVGDGDNDDNVHDLTPHPTLRASNRQQPPPSLSGSTRRTMTLTNPFSNPNELDALKRSFAEQPNWKAVMVEGECWEGTAEENIAKWQRLVGAN